MVILEKYKLWIQILSHFQLVICNKQGKCTGPNPFKCYNCAEVDCFPGTAKVNLHNGKSVKMSELQIGDQVKTGIAKVLFDFLCLIMNWN